MGTSCMFSFRGCCNHLYRALIFILLLFPFLSFASPGDDISATALASPASTGCYGNAETITVTIQNLGSTTISFSAGNPADITVNITGPNPQIFSTQVTSGMLAPSATMNVTLTTTYNMSAAGTYTFNATATITGDPNTSNDAMPPASRTVVAPSSLPQTVNFTGFAGNNLGSVFPGWSEAAGVNPAGSTSLWNFQTGLGMPGNITARINLFTTTRNEWIISPKFTATASTRLRFKAAVTDQSSITGPDVMGPDDKVRVMVSADCGVSWSPLMQFDAGTGLTMNLTQYGTNLGAYAGQDIIIGFYATDGPVDDINNYDFHLDDINIDNVTGIDAGVVSLAAPPASGCLTASETVTVNIRNHGFTAVNFATDSITVTVNVTGPNPQALSKVINTGTLAPGATMPVTVSTVYDMSIAGIYYFNASTSASSADYDLTNDAMPQAFSVSTTPIVSATGNPSVCAGDSASLIAAGIAYGPTSGSISFVSTATLPIPDNDTTWSTINVTSPLYAFELYSVSIDSLYHTFNADIELYLIAPNGSRINLSSDNGSSTDNYIGTRFIPSAAVSVQSGTGPYTGDYLPEQPFTYLSGPANGTWTLEVIDDATGLTGTLKGWKINMKTPNSIVSYNWSPATGLSATTGDSVNASPPTTTTYTVTMTDMNGCAASDIVTVTVYTVPSVSITSSNVLCNGGSTGSATAIVTGGTGSYTYTWSDAQTTQTATGLAAGSYSVTVTDQGMCTASASVTITEPPVLTVAASSTNETCVPGNDGTATATATGGAGSYTYSWSSGHTTSTATGLSANSYTVTATDSNGCMATATATVSPSTPPAVTASNDTTICEGAAITLTANGSGSYMWQPGGSTDSSIMVSPATTTIYTVTVTDGNGCASSEQVTVSVIELPVAGFSFTNPGSAVTFTNSSSNATSYTWDFGDGSPSDNSADPVHTYALDGTYYVTLVAANSCGADTITDTVVIITTGMDEIEAILTIAPNPSAGVFTISGANAGSYLHIEVLDVHGQLVLAVNEHGTGSAFTRAIDLSGFAKGIYYLKLHTGTQVITKRVITQ
jgi:trimeric autotransporter adhesin